MPPSHYLIAGCDEVGRGCLAGPVVAAAVILPKTQLLPKDSKQLTAKQRLTLDAIIREEAIDWAIGLASVQEIAQYNISEATYLAMHRAVAQLHLAPALLLVDGKYFRAHPTIKHQCVVRGDEQVSAIAAASILAKVYRDKYMQELAQEIPGYDWEHNKGYPTLAHRAAINKLGLSIHHRKSYRRALAQLCLEL